MKQIKDKIDTLVADKIEIPLDNQIGEDVKSIVIWGIYAPIYEAIYLRLCGYL